MKRNKKVARSCLAVILCVAMVLPIASCKKKAKEEGMPLSPVNTRETQYVKETDPYFSDTTIEFAIPSDASKTLEGVGTENIKLMKDKVVVAYSNQYLMTEEAKKELNGLNVQKPEELIRYFEINNALRIYGIATYSLTGELLSSFELEAGEYINGCYPLHDGRIAAFVSATKYEINEDSNQVEEKTERELVYFSEGGERLETYPSEAAGKVILQMENGNFLMLNNSEVLVMDQQGKILGSDLYKDYCDSGFCHEGKYYILVWKEKREGDTITYEKSIREVDPATAKLGEPKQVDTSIPSAFFDCGEACYSAQNGEPIQRIDVMKGEVSLLVDYAYTDLSPLVDVCDIMCEKDEDIYLLQRKDVKGNTSWVQSVPVLVHLHKEAKNPYAGRPILYMASCTEDTFSDFNQVISAYNKRPESKARVVTYSPPTEVVGYGAAQAAKSDLLLLEMKSGNGPDILLNCGEFSTFNTEGILLDLNPYMDGSNGIDRSKYYDNIFRAFEVGGKLYQLPLSVWVDGFLGNPDLLGEISGWTVSEFDSKMAGLGENAYPIFGHSFFLSKYWSEKSDQISDITSLGMLFELICHDFYHYVDYGEHTAHFDSDDFRKLLEISKKYGGILDFEKYLDLAERYDDMSDTGAEARVMQDGVSALAVMDYNDLRRFSATAQVCGGEPLYLGWPGSGTSGLAAMSSISVGISAYSNCKDEAWDFVSFLLSSDSVYDMIGGVVVSRDGLRRTAQAELSAYETKAEFYKDQPGMLAMEAVLTEESMAKYLSMAENIHSSVQVDLSVMAIVEEEAPAFFNGSKSADDVSKAIQNRVSTLLAEAQ